MFGVAAVLEPTAVLLFDASGSAGRYRVQVFSIQNSQIPVEWTFEVAEEWQQYEVDLRSSGACDVRGVMAIIVSGGSRGSFRFMLNNVRLVPG